MSIRNSKMGIVLAGDTGARGGRERGDGRGGGAGGSGRRYAGRGKRGPRVENTVWVFPPAAGSFSPDS